MRRSTAWAAAAVLLAVGGSAAAGGAGHRARDAQPASAPAADWKAHAELPDTEAATCLGCHEDVPKAKVVHAAVEGGCTVCHEFAGTGDDTKVGLAAGAGSGNTAALCVTCHDAVGERAEADVAHAPAALGDCVGCHRPHGSDHAALLASPPVDLCGTCHEGVSAEVKKATVHAPAAEGCATCHDPHGSKHPALLRDAVNPLCQACHAIPPASQRAKPLESVTLGERVVPAAGVPARMQLRLDRRGRGHPVANHPTAGDTDPLRKDRRFTCASCHRPHGTEVKQLLAFEIEPGQGVCQKCHPM